MKCPKCGSENVITSVSNFVKTSICQDCGHSFDNEWEQMMTEKKDKREERNQALAEKQSQKLQGKALSPKKPFFQNVAVIIASCIFLPPLGIFLLVRYSNHSKKKWFIVATSVWFAIVIVAALFSPNTNELQKDSNNNEGSSTQEEEVAIKEAKCAKYQENYCKSVVNYGDEDILKILGEIGIDEITFANSELNDSGQAVIAVATNNTDADHLFLTYDISTKKLLTIRNYKYDSIIYYPLNGEVNAFKYPAQEEIDRIKSENESQREAEQEYAKTHIVEDDYFDIATYIRNDIIKTFLDSPSTAKYQGSAVLPYDGWSIDNQGDHAVFSSYVDSQNVYGAMVRSSFSVTVCKRDSSIKVSEVIINDNQVASDPLKCQ